MACVGSCPCTARCLPLHGTSRQSRSPPPFSSFGLSTTPLVGFSHELAGHPPTIACRRKYVRRTACPSALRLLNLSWPQVSSANRELEDVHAQERHHRREIEVSVTPNVLVLPCPGHRLLRPTCSPPIRSRPVPYIRALHARCPMQGMRHELADLRQARSELSSNLKQVIQPPHHVALLLLLMGAAHHLLYGSLCCRSPQQPCFISTDKEAGS
jgi:hypothetical protein